jgi:hypothetical protein
MTMFKAAAAMREGEVLGGGEGRALMAGAEGSMVGERVKNAPRMVAMLAPGFETTTSLGRRRFVLPPRR